MVATVVMFYYAIKLTAMNKTMAGLKKGVTVRESKNVYRCKCIR